MGDSRDVKMSMISLAVRSHGLITNIISKISNNSFRLDKHF